MQLKKGGSVRNALTVATCTLLSSTPVMAWAGGQTPKWGIDSALLAYSETDRVSVIEPVVDLKMGLGEDEFLTGRLVFDSMSGASPNGATATNAIQTFTSPSGNTYTAAPNETPLRNFRDQRGALSIEWEKPLHRTLKGVFGGSFSTERDYASAGLSASLSWDINNRLTTLTGGLSYYADQVDPEGGTPVGLADISVDAGGGQNDKSSTDLLVGVTQVLGRRTLMQFNYSHGISDGYLTDPYKILSVVDGVTGQTLDYRYEHRPDSRTRDILFWKTIYHLRKDVIRFSYRYYTDDWGIDSHTLDMKYRYELSGDRYLQPHLRYYTQTASDFYRHSLVQTDPLPTYASADYRLGELTSTTAGLKFGTRWGQDSDLSVRLEYMLQSGESHPTDAIGVQKSQDLFPDVEAWILFLSYSTSF